MYKKYKRMDLPNTKEYIIIIIIIIIIITAIEFSLGGNSPNTIKYKTQ
jgi:hypothetical protein